MEVNKIEKKIRVSPLDLVKYQVLTEIVFLKKEHVIPSDVEFLSLLALWGPMELSVFCTKAVEVSYKDENSGTKNREQNVRNRMTKLEKRGFVVKVSGKSKKVIKVNPEYKIFCTGNTLLDYKLLATRE